MAGNSNLNKIILINLLIFQINLNSYNFFNNLKDIETFANSNEEFPAPDTNDLINPSYQKFHLSRINNNFNIIKI